MKTTTPGDIAFLQTAVWQIDVAFTMQASPDRVWATFTDNEGWAKWFKNCKSCTSTSTPAGGVGSTRTINVNGLRVDERFIGWEVERLWAFTALRLSRGFAECLVECIRMEPGDNGATTLNYRMAANPTWWAKPLRSLMYKTVKASWVKSFATLDKQLTQT
jgi:hypothetical protein